MRATVEHVLISVCLALAVRLAHADDRPAKDPAPRTDLYGDPLPDGAVARLGSSRFRQAGISDFVFLSDGKTVLSCGRDRVLRFWDTANGKLIRTVKLEGKAGDSFALSPDGKTLAGHEDGLLVIWEVATGKELKTVSIPKGNIRYLTFSADGKTLAVGTCNWRVSFWEWQTGKERQVMLPILPRDLVQITIDSSTHGSFSPDGKWFVGGGHAEQPLGVFEAATGREVYRFNCNASTSTVSPDGTRLAVSSWQNSKGERETALRLFDLTNGKELQQFPLEQNEPFYSLAFSPDGKTLACGFSDNSCLVDVGTGRILHRLSGRPISMVFAPDGKMLAASSGHQLRFWDVVSGKELQERPGEFGWIPVLAASPDGRMLASADWGAQEVSLWDTSSGKLLRQLPLKGEQQYVRNLTFSADGKTLAACQYHGFIQFWDAATGQDQRTLQLAEPGRANQGSAYYYQVRMSADGKRVTTLERFFAQPETTRVGLWDGATGKFVSGHQLPAETRLGFWLGDGAKVALSLPDGLTLTEVEGGTTLFRVPRTLRSGQVSGSADERLLACPKDTAVSVGVWESVTGKKVATVSTGPVAHLALGTDNRSLVTTDKEFLHVWDLATGKERKRWQLPEPGVDISGETFVLALLLSPDGRRAFTALADGTALVWDLSPALKPSQPLVKDPGEKELASWWTDLAGKDAAAAYAAVWRLADTPPDTAVAFLRQHLKPVVAADPDKVRALVADLDSDAFAVRDNAFKQLEDLGISAVPSLRQLLKKDQSLEVRRRLETLLVRAPDPAASPELLRRLRAIQVLERLNGKDARSLLTDLSGGVAEAAETQEAPRGAGSPVSASHPLTPTHRPGSA
jgi:WD40 repeat protein